ncbi:hypothetical protein [Thauera sp. Sel9]|uniref:hypothetical protein n=1 Tax=Thauera sp. Sel9 TaxID=2974299 RepID=UPI0021E1959F|nr:hypothetical protein [Thauera sp. Sel9]MCV2218875.1 hypothetical protein [Thauera sp. Sel9]
MAWLLELRDCTTVDEHNRHYRDVPKEEFRDIYLDAHSRLGGKHDGSEKWNSFYKNFSGMFLVDDRCSSQEDCCIVIQSSINENIAKIRFCDAAAGRQVRAIVIESINEAISHKTLDSE